jgi:hypothetical protein
MEDDMLFLTEQEVIETTGARRRATQKERLERLGIRAIDNGKRLLVAREALIRYMLNEKSAAAEKVRPTPRLDLEGIRT